MKIPWQGTRIRNPVRRRLWLSPVTFGTGDNAAVALPSVMVVWQTPESPTRRVQLPNVGVSLELARAIVLSTYNCVPSSVLYYNSRSQGEYPFDIFNFRPRIVLRDFKNQYRGSLLARVSFARGVIKRNVIKTVSRCITIGNSQQYSYIIWWRCRKWKFYKSFKFSIA